MPPKRNKSVRSKRPVRRRTKRSNRGSSRYQHLYSVVIDTLQTKQNHLKEELYPLSLNKLISRVNIGSDVDVRLVGYTFSLTLATGNDCSTVSLNCSHSGPWVRRGDSVTDSFDQQFYEHTVAVSPKGCLFRKSILGRSELEYLNPDVANNFINLRVRDPCGVIPGVVIRYEFRAHLVRRVPESVFVNGNQQATDRYEDQDVSTGTSSGSPSPPSAIKHAPAVITTPGSQVYIAEDSDPTVIEYVRMGFVGAVYTVSKTTPPQAVSGIFRIGNGDLQQQFNTAGYDGTITHV